MVQQRTIVPMTPKTEPGICGCGVSDEDADNNGAVSCEEECKYSKWLLQCSSSQYSGPVDGKCECLDCQRLHRLRIGPHTRNFALNPRVAHSDEKAFEVLFI